MKLNLTKDMQGNLVHSGTIFEGAEERTYAYQGEGGVHTAIHLEAWPPSRRAGKENWNLDESKYSRYELIIERHTGTGISIKFVGHRKDIVDQRKISGRAIERDVLIDGLTFGELINRIFSKGEYQVIQETESFPKCIEEAMKEAYP